MSNPKENIMSLISQSGPNWLTKLSKECNDIIDQDKDLVAPFSEMGLFEKAYEISSRIDDWAERASGIEGWRECTKSSERKDLGAILVLILTLCYQRGIDLAGAIVKYILNK